MSENIHQPLGQDKRSGNTKPERKKPAWKQAAALTLVIGTVIGGASWMAFSGAVTNPDTHTVIITSPDTKPKPTKSDQKTTPVSPDQIAQNQGLPRNNGSLNSDHGQSGANVSVTLGDSGEEIKKFSPTQRPDNRPVLITPTGTIGQESHFAHLPDPAISQNGPDGILPIRGKNGERAFDIYARPWSGTRGARVVIIVGGLGLSQTGTQYAIETLPDEITLAFAAAGNSLQRWMQQARRQGHEILLQVPFEPFDYPRNDPGRGTLTIAAGAQANLEDLHKAMGRITNYTGITNFMGGRFLSDPDALEPIMRDIANRGLMFLDDGTSARSLTDKFAEAFGMPYAAADMVLDNTQERGAILEKLDDLERVARRNGVAIGVASAFKVSVDAIATWANEAKARGIEIVSASAAATDPERR